MRMPGPAVTAVGDHRPVSGITVGVAAAAWLASWVGGNVLAAAVLSALGRSGSSDDVTPVWATAVGALSLWLPMVLVLVHVSRRYGEGSWRADLGLAIRPVDLLGIPLGAATQLGLLRLVYWPLERGWPDTFAPERLERSAREMYDSAHGAWMVVLVAVVVVGAPTVEELVYRGLLQRTFVRCNGAAIGVPLVAAWFALIHFRPVEYPGLFAFGLVVGACAWRTGRLGMSWLTHVAFNATGLIWVATR